jgi:hypothetical protein
MAQFKKTKVLDPVDAAYIAGLIDGEGTISLSRKHRGDNRQLVISIANTEFRLLEFVQTAVGAGKITRKRTYRSAHTPSGAYTVTNRQALDLLKRVAPFLQSYKSERAALILANYLQLTPRNGRYSPAQREARESFVEKFLRVRPV